MPGITRQTLLVALASVVLGAATPLAAQTAPAPSTAATPGTAGSPGKTTNTAPGAVAIVNAGAAEQALASAPLHAAGHAAPSMPEFPQLSLSASAWREVTQDRVAVTLYASHEAKEPGPAQAQVNETLNPVLARLKDRRDLEVQSAGYRTNPVWQDSRIVTWRARGSIRLTGTPSEDFNKLVGELSTQLNVESVSHFLSREAQLATEEALIGEAVAAFRAKAEASARALGFPNWAVRSVSVNDSGPSQPEPMPKMMMSRGVAAEAAPMPLAEGRTTVSVSVGGTVLLLHR